ncbi:MAG: RNA polymerase sigma-54 factor, partial [Chlamydiia bacterium]|nr:RNA polymerase sigma-54 factor [Chlamydiia bacterium]
MSGPPSFKLEQKQTQNLKQSQLLMMMPQMQQAIALLQAPTLELMQIVDMEMERNPLLEYLEELGAEQETPSEAVAFEEQELRFKENDFSILKRLDDEFRDLFNEAGESYVPKESASKHHAYVEQSIIAPESLFEHLMEQAHQTFLEESDMQVAEIIIGSLDEL